MTELFNKVRMFVQQSFKGNQAQMVHFDRTVYWLQQLKPDADEAFLIAAIAHDIQRACRDPSIDMADTSQSVTVHQEKGAEIVGEFLQNSGANEKFIARVKHLVSKHEVGGDEDQDLLKDVDSLSFLENNAPIFITNLHKFGFNRLKEKFDFMYNRISDPKAKEIAKPFYEKMIEQLNTANAKKTA